MRAHDTMDARQSEAVCQIIVCHSCNLQVYIKGYSQLFMSFPTLRFVGPLNFEGEIASGTRNIYETRSHVSHNDPIQQKKSNNATFAWCILPYLFVCYKRFDSAIFPTSRL